MKGMPQEFTAARYHSIYAQVETFPECLEVVAQTAEGVIMALQHKDLPIAAVQFHPESILTAHEHGIRMITNVIEHFRSLSK
jgi:anthranilate/para-aminobenzoate synthase component II